MRRRAFRHAAVLPLVLAGCGAALSACSTEEHTELVVAVYSDIPIPTEMDGLRIRAARLDGSGEILDAEQVQAELAGTGDLPKWLVLAHRGGPLGPIDVTADGFFGDTVVVTQRARTSFLSGQRLVLTLRLLRSCAGIDCGADMTCTAAGCASIDVDPASLVEWPGSIDRVDGSVPTDRCPDGFDDCDGDAANGCETNLRAPASCGSCGSECPEPPGAAPTCTSETCGFVCDEGRADCNGSAADGCETDLASPASCGGCGVACVDPMPRCGMHPDTGARVCVSGCPPAVPVDCAGSCVATDTDPDHCGTCFLECPERPNAAPACSDGVCGFECSAGFGDCDGLIENGCETPLTTLTDCGSCGMSCSLTRATPTCVGGTCDIASCDEGYDDCDADASTGCEASLTTVSDCGGCAMACTRPNAVESCAPGTCMLVACDTDYADCNANELDGCEAFTSSLTDCAGCGIACSLSNATETCTTGSCEIVSCDVGFDDCDGAPDTGCETSLRTTSDCGTCGTACSLPRAAETCATGSCAIESCDPGFADCNGVVSDGCEASLSSTATCGDCTTTCGVATPICDPATGCVTGCAAGEDLCGGSCVDLRTDPSHCGACDAACSTVNATPSCVVRSCVLACDAGWEDCNGDVTDGCETPITTLTDCGACGVNCSRANGTESCATGTCTLTGCDMDFGNCDSIGTNGCETSLITLSDCGTCGTACDLANATESCATGTCTLTMCSDGFDDCDGLVGNGCETALTTLASCGACGTTCDLANASESCTSGTCTLSSCNTGWGNCDSDPSDGCERSLTTLTDCGSCGTPCLLPHATESCSGGTCSIGTCDSNWGNCDSMTANGCETDLRVSDAHCGMCGAACTFPTTCRSSACGCASGCDCVQTGCAPGSTCLCDDGCDCVLTCAEDCRSTCTGTGTVCTVDARVMQADDIECLAGATCSIDARGIQQLGEGSTDPVRCEGSGTTCDVDCGRNGGTRTGTCRVDCVAGAECLLQCEASSTTCSFTSCSGGSGQDSCGGGLYACNRACP